jgi:hypothetical protein
MRDLCCQCLLCQEERETVDLATAYVNARCAAEKAGSEGEQADALARSLFALLKERTEGTP